MLIKKMVLLIVSIFVVSVVILDSSPVLASHIDFAQRRAEREARQAQRQAELAERRAQRQAAREARREQQNGQEEEGESSCSCSARLSYSRPSLQFNRGVLQFVPRLNISVRSRGDAADPAWTAHIAYEGATSYSSDDVVVPGGVSFNGERDVFGGACGDDFSFTGYQLPAVPLTGLTRAFLGDDQKLEGKLRMNTVLSGCEIEEEQRQFTFSMKELGNLRVRSWRTVR